MAILAALRFLLNIQVPQKVSEGTVNPTHYTIIHEPLERRAAEIGVDNAFDLLQPLAYNLTFSYFNWPGAIRVPAPCQVGSAQRCFASLRFLICASLLFSIVCSQDGLSRRSIAQVHEAGREPVDAALLPLSAAAPDSP